MTSGDTSGWMPSEYVPLREQVRDELRARIISGRLSPGERLVELTLAADLGVSRVPVREAMRLLEAEGFVEVLPRRGVVVRQLARKDVEDLFEMRTALEVLACELAATRATADQLKQLQRSVATGKKAIRTGSSELATSASAEFHDTIVQMAGNRLLTSTLAPLNGRLRWLFQQNNDPVLMFEEHQRILDAVADRDPGKAGRLAREHVLRSRRTTMTTLFGELGEPTASAG
ncbi:GntR family transcriptional regulator [Streptomyces sp. NPDC056165]|uniref:GntR family transcriptional regulator n=1 Tax=Streptomyces sp. NPDC056165 TaxID=3345733 RepID=UPI0035DD9E7E